MVSLKITPGVTGYMNLTITERGTIQHVERFGASLSLVGVFLIIIAYGVLKRLRTIPNTFIFFASIANIGASVACLIGYDGIYSGDDSALCQFQAFLLEMFMQSDPWWSLAMAVNVFMVFFLSVNPNSSKKYMILYCIICFGIPAVPAFICLFYMPNGDRIYGNATLWCWFGDHFNQLRIYLYYLPIWTCSVLSGVIYLAVGYQVFHQRNQLRNLTLSTQPRGASGSDIEASTEKGRVGQQGMYPTITTEVQITAEAPDNQTITPPSSPTPSVAAVLPAPQSPVDIHRWPAPNKPNEHSHASPSTANSHNPFRIISSITSAQVQEREKEPQRSPLQKAKVAWRRFRTKLRNLDPVKLAYLRTSFLFAISILITWTPSSINRVYSFIHPKETSYTLNLASAIVLPLQGVWNAVIFCATSWNVLKAETWDLWSRHCKNGRSERLPSEDHTGGNKRGVINMGPYGRDLDNGRRASNVRVLKGGSL